MEMVFVIEQGFPSFTRNGLNNCHGGALATYVDCLTVLAVIAFDKKRRVCQSMKLDMTYISGGKINDGTIEIKCIIDKIGNTLAFTKAVIKNLQSGKVICEGTHVVTFGPEGSGPLGGPSIYDD